MICAAASAPVISASNTSALSSALMRVLWVDLKYVMAPHPVLPLSWDPLEYEMILSWGICAQCLAWASAALSFPSGRRSRPVRTQFRQCGRMYGLLHLGARSARVCSRDR